MNNEAIEKKEKKKTDVTEALLNLLNSSTKGGNQYVTFRIGTEEYGIGIKSVQEISAYRALTHLPNTPDFIKGILNLRGNVIPIMDPRVRFGLPEVEHAKSSVIIIFKTQEKVVGMIVDQISDVLTIETKDVEETPDVSIDINRQYLLGIGKVGERFVIILNIDKIVAKDELNSF